MFISIDVTIHILHSKDKRPADIQKEIVLVYSNTIDKMKLNGVCRGFSGGTSRYKVGQDSRITGIL